MRKTAVVVLSAILLPSAILGGFVLRSASEQQLVLRRRTSTLYQNLTDDLALRIGDTIRVQQRVFETKLETLLGDSTAPELANDFATRLSESWPRVSMGFAVTLNGRLLSPQADSPESEARFFAARYRAFLEGTAGAEIYRFAKSPHPVEGPRSRFYRLGRVVEPQNPVETELQDSMFELWTLPFGELVGNATSGALSRYVDSRLEILLWRRPPGASDLVFGAMLLPEDLIDLWKPFFRTGRESLGHPDAGSSEPGSGIVFALLNETGVPVLVNSSTFVTEWRRPLVASQIGEALPSWEAVLYLADPRELEQQANLVKHTLWFLVALAFAAIGAASSTRSGAGTTMAPRARSIRSSSD